jgi:hypothetical protein
MKMFGLFKKKVEVVDNREKLDSFDIKSKILELKRMSYQDLVNNYRNFDDVKHRIDLIKEPTVSLIKLIRARGITYTNIATGVFEVKVNGTEIVIDFTSSKWSNKDEASVNIFEGIRLNDYEVSCLAYHLDDLISEEFGRKQVALRKSSEEKLNKYLEEV